MKILADESVDMPVYEYLKQAGFSIEHISFVHSGIADVDVLGLAYSQKRILLTVDKDFGELAFRNKRPSYGIVLYRLSGLTNLQKANIVLRVFTERPTELHSNFTVISKKQVRIKKLIVKF